MESSRSSEVLVPPGDGVAPLVSAIRARKSEAHIVLSVPGALDHLIDAAQRVVADQVSLALLEAHETLRRTLSGAALLMLGTLLAAMAWGAIMIAAHDLLAQRMAPWQSLGVIGLANGFLGASAVIAGVRHARGRETVETFGTS
jgi:putative superfamily III holin-X